MGARLSKGAKAKASTAAPNPLRFVCTHKSHQIRTTEMVSGLQRILPNIGEHSRASSETCTDKHANMRACIAPHASTLPCAHRAPHLVLGLRGEFQICECLSIVAQTKPISTKPTASFDCYFVKCNGGLHHQANKIKFLRPTKILPSNLIFETGEEHPMKGTCTHTVYCDGRMHISCTCIDQMWRQMWRMQMVRQQ